MFSWIKRHRLPVAIAGLILVPAVAYAIAISGLTSLTAGNTASGDQLVIVDVSEAAAADRTKNITLSALFDNIPVNVGIGVTPDGILHVHSGSAGAVTADIGGDEAVFEGSSNSGISILVPNANNASVYFGSPADNLGALLDYQQFLARLRIGTSLADGVVQFHSGNFVEAMRINSNQSIDFGTKVTADELGEFAFASGQFAAESDAHTSIFMLRNSTTDATQTELFADGSAADISVASDCGFTFRITVDARRTDADNESASYFFEGKIDNNAGTTALVGTIGKTIIAEDTAAWDATVTADDTNDGINVLVTGEAAKTIRWGARAEITEICG